MNARSNDLLGRTSKLQPAGESSGQPCAIERRESADAEQRYRSILDNLQEMVCRFCPDGTILYANQSYADTLGVTTDELIGANFWDYVDESDRAKVKALLDGLKPDAPLVTIENRLETAEGTRWTRWTNRALVFDDHGRVVEAQSSGVDITARKRAEQAQALLAAIVSSSDDAIISISVDGQITSWNSGAEHLYGYTADEVIGQPVRMLIPGDRLEEEQQMLSRVQRGERVRHFETVRQAKNGRRVDISLTVSPIEDAHGNIVGASKVARDISRRKRSEKALRDSEARFRLMADNAPVMIWVTERDGRCSYRSRTWYEFTGQTPDTALGLGWLDAVHPDERPDVQRKYEQSNKDCEPFRFEYRVRRHDGAHRWTIDAAAPRFDDDGRFLGFIGSVMDITGRKRNEQKMKLVMQELNHRVKNTLAVVSSTAEQTMRHAVSLEQFKTAFSERLRAMSNAHGLLTRTKWEGASLRNLVRVELEHRVQTDQQVHLDGPHIMLEPNVALAMHMVVHELSTNAAKYGALSSPDGRVAVDWWIEQTDAGAPSVVMRWIESGGPVITPPVRRGFGTKVLNRTVQHELDGDVELLFEPEGLQCTIRFPMPDCAGGPATTHPDLLP